MTLKDFNARITSCIKLFTKVNEKVFSKFLQDTVRGILLSKSICVADMARSLESMSATTAKHIYKRLDRNLGEWDVNEVKERVQAKQIGLLDEETFIYFDPTEVVKEYGDEFEAIGQVADGSDDYRVKPGYHVNVCVGLKGSEIIPLELNLYSSAQEAFDSQNQEWLSPIETIVHRSKKKGIFVMDRGFDRYAIIRHLHELSVNFIIRMGENRHYRPIGLGHRHYSRQELIERFSTVKTKVLMDVRIKKKLVKKLFTISAAPVTLLERIDSSRSLTLICAKASSMTLYFLTNVEEINAESLVNILEAYLNRWKVDEFIRFLKQQYKAEEFKVRSLGRIKNLFALLFIALVVLTRISELDTTFSKAKAILIRYAKRVFKIPQKMRFFLYTLADGLSEVLKKITKPLLQLWTTKPKYQLSLSFGRIT